MLKADIDRNFERWWKSRSEAVNGDKESYRDAFTAGCVFVEQKKFKSYRFQAGRWRVSVEATSYRDAKIIAVAKLNQRAERLSASPPTGGWKLERLADDLQSMKGP
ncbi:hypothetical protein SAMN05428983_0832 [Agrobacterium fabrum]|uniref:Uncharacterized protein n=1 Tax=Agrobacterium fabrum TaxID=1176649 RepID=A0A7Z7BHG7_9HYPH|nr:hypothetical protein [Agrobacterium fabrum]SDJ25283.1 hypothetical protein SAMN05428983_0832 [Agrobacterium fabrum]